MFAIMFVLVLCLSSQIEAQLRVGFYRNKCPNAESIIRDEVGKAFFRDKGIAPGLVRMHFHDCFVRVKFHDTSKMHMKWFFQSYIFFF